MRFVRGLRLRGFWWVRSSDNDWLLVDFLLHATYRRLTTHSGVWKHDFQAQELERMFRLNRAKPVVAAGRREIDAPAFVHVLSGGFGGLHIQKVEQFRSRGCSVRGKLFCRLALNRTSVASLQLTDLSRGQSERINDNANLHLMWIRATEKTTFYVFTLENACACAVI